MTQQEVHKIITSSKPTTCRSDPWPSTLVKMHVTTLLPVLTKLVNLSLTCGVFSTEWKTSIILPLLKKTGLALEKKNYRPVNNLPFVGKLVEKSMLSQLNTYMETNDLLPDHLSAYRQNYSTETVLIKLLNDLLLSMDSQRVTLLTAVDLSAAFDTVDHDILLNILQKSYGVGESALRWFDEYLRPRQIKVQIKDSVSTARDLPFSVPQGSCAGPVLYNIYASSLPAVIQDFSVCILGYADDQLTYDSFRASRREEELCTVNKIESCLNTVNSWMKENRLKMNP